MIPALILSLAVAPSTLPTTPSPRAERPWTLLVYGAADNNADGPILDFLDGVRKAIDDDPGIDVLLLIDRSKRFSKDAELLGEDFSGTRLYRLRARSAERLAGGKEMPELTLEHDTELDTADANVLARFLAFGKAHAPAQHYGLMIYSHADGRTMCPDEETKTSMGITEVTRLIDSSRSVDFLALELCNMGGIEIAYQWRPGTERFGADVLVAIPNAGPPLDWDRAFARIRSKGHAGGAAEPFLDPATMTALDFGRLVIEEGEKGRKAAQDSDGGREAAGCYDLRAVAGVKNAIDALAKTASNDVGKSVFLAARGSETDHAFNYDEGGPLVDLYDLCRRASKDERLGDAARRATEQVMRAVDTFVVASFGMSGYPGFEAGKNGVFIVLPAGDEMEGRVRRWKRFAWYTPRALEARDGRTGNWRFLADGATPGNGVVENWYELLDSWFDPDPDGTGGVNEYRW